MSTKKIQVIGSMVPQSDWAQTDESKVDYIKNKPELGNLAAKNTVEKSDLTTDVQTSLGKADTALQSYTETDPTVPAWAKASVKPTYTANEVGAEASGTVSAHNSSTSAHNDIRTLINDLTTRLNTIANSDDTTLDQMSEIVAYIKSNKSLIDNITTNKVNVSDVINLLTSDDTKKPLSAAQGKALKALIDALQSSKADGDTLTSHTGNTTAHITSAERANWNAAKTHADSSHAPSNAEKNQNAFSNIAVSGQTTVAADTATDTVTFAGSNVTITTDATNDKVTFSVADGSTSAKGVVQLTNSTSSTSTTTAATPNSVKSAYDLANQAKTAAATAQSTADGKANASHKHTKSEITDFPTSMPASDVSAWAKASSKPTYTASEVGARPSTWTPSASDVGAVPTSRTVNGKTLSSNITLSASDVGAAPAYQYSTTDLTAGSSSLATGTLYFVYE